jgi:hypothetical protein
MTQLPADVLPAAMLGLFIAIPFGPICLMCVQRTLAFGIWFGIASSMGLRSHTDCSVSWPPSRCRCRYALREGSPSSSWASEPAASPFASREAKCGDLRSAFMSTLLIAAARGSSDTFAQQRVFILIMHAVRGANSVSRRCANVRGRGAKEPPEFAVECRQIAEADVVSDGADRVMGLVRVHEHAMRLGETSAEHVSR